MKNKLQIFNKRETNSIPLSNRVYDQLKRDILTDKLKPGEPLIETDIAKAFETSRTPVREAFKRLQSERLVTAYPGRGTRVSEVSTLDLIEALEIREQLEPYVARKAASRVTEENKIQINTTLNSLSEIANEPVDLVKLISFDLQLHDLILRMAGNRTMRAVLREMHMRFRRSYPIFGRYAETTQEHRRLLEAILKGDENEAEIQMKKHLSGFRNRLLGKRDVD